MKETIRHNLQNLFDQQFDQIKKLSFSDFIDAVIKGDSEMVYIDSDTYSISPLYDEEEALKLENLKTNQKLASLYNALISKLNPEFNIADRFKVDILNSIKIIKEQINQNLNGVENQIIFLEYDYDPTACFCGFGPGDYPILKEPKYLDFNYEVEVFNGIGEINYEEFWKEKIEFEALLSEMDEEIDLGDLIFNTEIYEYLRAAYKFKTDLLLFDAFDQIPVESFDGIPIKLPLFIFSNEHDCEQMNVYVYE